MTLPEKTALTPWGIGIEDAEERLAWHRSAAPWESLAIHRNFSDPFTHELKHFINSLQALGGFQGVLANREEFRKSLKGIGKIHLGLSFVSIQEELELAFEGMQEFEEALEPIWSVLELYGKRARTRKDEMARLLKNFRKRAESLKIQAKTIRGTHFLLKDHFQSQLFEVPRSRKTDNVEVAMFYDPLYRYRDAYFHQPSLEVLSKYLESWRVLLEEPYYRNMVISSVDPDKLEQAEEKTEKLALELELELLWGRTARVGK